VSTDWAGRRLHFVGIGGAGMSGLALVAHALGASVTGSDRAAGSPYAAALRTAGIEPAIGHDAANVPDGAEVVVSTAIPPDNPERAAARERGLGELHRAELLGELTRLRPTIAVTGTHGKTTTASMLVHALRGCGMDPGYLVGGAVRSTGANAGWGAGEWLVVEADESDRSLLSLAPAIAVLTNAELDHHTTYASRRDVDETFRAFLALATRAAVVAVFQPHLFSRTAHQAAEFGAALAAADEVVVLDIYPARERPEDYPGVTGLLVAEAAADAAGGKPVAWMPTAAQAEAYLRERLRDGDLALTLGAGDVDALGRALAGG
jgi:UDP-N-acetylmuramate-alanine ligase